MTPRVFVYDGREFPDPDPNMTTEEVRQFMANMLPELSNADTTHTARKTKTEPVVNEEIYEFRKRVGTKGG